VRILHICIYFRNPMFMGLMKGQEEVGTEKRVFYYETRKIGLKEFNLPYVDSLSSNVSYLPSPFLRFARLNIVKKKMIDLYKNDHIFDCIHAHTIIADGYLALAAYKQWGIPYVLTVRDSDFNFKPYWSLRGYRKIVSQILYNAKKLIFLSETSKISFLNRLTEQEREKLSDTEMFVIPNGIDDFWHQNEFDRTTVEAINKKEWNIITVGKLCKRKNQVICCEAIKRLKEEGYHINYEIVGKPEDKKIHDEILSYEFVDYKEHMDKEKLILEYRNNDIFLLASTNETFGLVYAEALSQGLPVIYTRGQGFDGQFPEGYIGYSTNSTEVNEIVDSIRKAINNYSSILQNTVGASSKFNWFSVAKEFAEVYESASSGEKG
jgi:glycosyltransferase involved in cell wall biosynthesis